MLTIICALICLLCSLHLALTRRVNDFYKIYYFSWRYPLIGLQMDRTVKKKYPDVEKRLRHLKHCTISLFKALPPGTYQAVTIEPVISGLNKMEQKGKAKMISCRKHKSKSQKDIHCHVLGFFTRLPVLPKLQQYKITFTIEPKAAP